MARVEHPLESEKSITNRDELRKHIHNLHNFMRNKGIGYGMDALNIFNLFYGLKMLEPLIREGKITFENNENCLFSNLVKLANEDPTALIGHLLMNKDCTVNALKNNSLTRGTIYSEMNKDINITEINRFIIQINRIEPKFDVHLAGKVYEYFIGRDSKDIDDLGAYYTDRHITSFILDKMNPKPSKDGHIPSFIDPFGGSGGFTLNYVSRMIKLAKEKGIDIDWGEEIKRIWHTDINFNVVRMVRMELFALTKVFPNDYFFRTIIKLNSFEDLFLDDEDKPASFDYVISNPPYGGSGDKDSKITAEVCSNRIQRYVTKSNRPIELSRKGKPLNYKIICNDKESCSVVLFLSLLKEHGKCGAVLKEGIFFDQKYKTLWEDMVENYRITNIISIPQDAFENTSTKTSIIILEKRGKTEKIVFSELAIGKDKSGNIKTIEEKELLIVSYEDLVKNGYSLYYKEYIKIDKQCNNNFKMIKLGNICEINPRRTMEKTGIYTYVEISNISNGNINGAKQYHVNDLPQNAKLFCNINDILIATVRPKKEKCLLVTDTICDPTKYIFSGAFAQIRMKKEYEFMVHYVYSYLTEFLVDSFEENYCSGSQYPRFNGAVLKDVKICVPKSNDELIQLSDKFSESYKQFNKLKLEMNKTKLQYLSKVQALEQMIQPKVDYNQKYHEICENMRALGVDVKEVKVRDNTKKLEEKYEEVCKKMEVLMKK